MDNVHFGRGHPPFRDKTGRDPRTDPVVMSFVRRAQARGLTTANFPRWLGRFRAYLRDNYDYSSGVAAGNDLDYIWVVVIAHLLACECAEEDEAGFFGPHLPFALVDPSGRLNEEGAFILHVATLAHALLFPMNFAERLASAVGTQTSALMEAATYVLALRHPVQEYALPSLMDVSALFRQTAMEATTPELRWTANVMHMSTVLVGEKSGPQITRLHSRPDRRKRKKRKK